MGNIDFWYSIGSTYSYLTVMRLPKLTQEYGVDIRWRPFNVRDVMVEQNNVPFSNKPIRKPNLYLGFPPANRADPIRLVVNLRVPYRLTQRPVQAHLHKSIRITTFCTTAPA